MLFWPLCAPRNFVAKHAKCGFSYPSYGLVLPVGRDKGSQKRDIATAKQMAAAIRGEQ
jgi:hypothetical protein